jgi:alanine racemase
MSNHATATLEIDLKALIHNYNALKRLSGRGDIAPVIKADAYGLGMAEIARALSSNGAEIFFVARLEEGVSLRRILPKAVIYVLDGLAKGQSGTFSNNNLRPVINSLDEYARWISGDTSLIAAIQFDTGMNRLGLRPNEVYQIKSKPNTHTLSLILSHLACADEADNPMTQKQWSEFKFLSDGFLGTPKSLSNSAGLFHGKSFQLDLARPGISLYGGGPFGESHSDLLPVAHLKARVLQVRELKASESVGYGALFIAPRDMKIATLGIGYADGLNRSLSGRGQVMINDKLCPILGRVSMDSLSIDVTGHTVQAGDMATLFGTAPNLDDQAKAAGSISYELLTRLGSRFNRHYTS